MKERELICTVVDHNLNAGFGEAIYVAHDEEDTNKFCKMYTEETDGECDLVIYCYYKYPEASEKKCRYGVYYSYGDKEYNICRKKKGSLTIRETVHSFEKAIERMTYFEDE